MPSIIRTPDQRVRVFISSTIGELADERKAAREAIEKLHLIPVFFEAGARPHPPRDLYRAYLRQSHIFVGIYWDRYGWVAPGMDISGLEDEYLLSEGKPRLIYVKDSAGQREPRLTDLLKKIEEKGAVCYQHFRTPEELEKQLANDLALMLSEHFQDMTDDSLEPSPDQRTLLPVIRNVIVGREHEIKMVSELLLKPEVPLVSITGAGGTGKTRLGLHVANTIAPQFRDGVFFIPLASLTEPQGFVLFLNQHLGLFDSGKQDPMEAAIHFLFDKQALIFLDNFEHVVTMAHHVAEILSVCRHIKIMVTSRTPLHLSMETVFPLLPLPVSRDPSTREGGDDSTIPAVHLFLLRAREINPSLPLDASNLEAVVQICRKLDGIPLAIELAAARTRIMTPTALLGRMTRVLDTLVHGQSDIPQRHKTLRATIDWSHDLLDEPGKTIFRRLGVFSGYWNLEDAEAIVNREKYDIVEMMEKLLDVGLIQSTFAEGDVVFSMFEMVRAYALERLDLAQETDTICQLHLQYHVHLVEETKPYTWTSQRVVWFKRLDRESNHIRDAFDYAVKKADWRAAWTIIQSLGFYWCFYGKITEALQWIDAARVNADESISGDIQTGIPLVVRAGAFRASGMVHFFASTFPRAVKDLQESIRLYQEAGVDLEAGRAMSYAAVAGISMGDFQASQYFEQAMAIARKYDDKHNLIISSAFYSEILISIRQVDKAMAIVEEALRISRQHDDPLLIALALGQTGNIKLIQGDFEGAEQAYRDSLSRAIEMPLGSMKGWFEIGLAYCLLIRRQFADSHTYFVMGVQSGRAAGDKAIILSGFIGLSSLHLHQGDIHRAAWLYGAAEEMQRQSGYTMWNATRKMQSEVTEQFAALPDQALIEKSKAEGAASTLDQSVAFATAITG